MNTELFSNGNDFGKRLTAIEIIDETVAFYSADVSRRSKKEDGGCAYAGKGGTKCAYSRCWREGVWRKEYEDKIVISFSMPKPDELVEERYKGHDPSFWLQLQRFHDNDNYWDEMGLTDEGREYVKQLKRNFSN